MSFSIVSDADKGCRVFSEGPEEITKEQNKSQFLAQC